MVLILIFGEVLGLYGWVHAVLRNMHQATFSIFPYSALESLLLLPPPGFLGHMNTLCLCMDTMLRSR